MPKPAPEALTAPVDWQQLSEGAKVILGDLEMLATKHERPDVARVIQVVEFMASYPAVAQLIASGINLLRQRWGH